VRVLDSLEPPVHTGRRPAYLPEDVELVQGGVADRAVFQHALEGVEAVVHLAAYQDYLTDFSSFFLSNTVGTALLYELVVQGGLPIHRILVASTQAIYGEGKHRCQEHGVVYPDQRPASQLERGDWAVYCSACRTQLEPLWTDEAVVRPHNSYAISKRAAEELALTLGQRYEIPTVALRYSIVQGPRQSFRNAYSGALRSFAVRVLTGHRPLVYEDGQQLRDFVSIHDVVRANLIALEDRRADHGAFNVGGARRVSVLDLAGLVLAEAGSSLEPEISGLFRVGDTRHVFSDVSRLEGLGWRPEVPMHDIVREYVAWAADQPDLHDTVSPALAEMHSMGVLRAVASADA